MEPKTRVLMLPIFRRYWLWHAEQAAVAADATAGAKVGHLALRNWREGRNIEEKAQLLGQQLNQWVQNRLWTEWRKLETAKEGSLRNRGYRLAQAVLSREDPQETFLKNLPSKPAPMEVIYPSAFKERLVRRRLRHLAAEGRRRHTMRLILWALAMVPQAPLMLTPLPNITVYYTGYRIYSHLRALQGTRTLEQGLAQINSKQLRDLRDQLLLYQERHPGFQFPPGDWPAKLMRKEHRYLDMLENLTYIEKLRRLQLLREEQEVQHIPSEQLEQQQPPSSQKQPSQQKQQKQQQQQQQHAHEPLLTFMPSVELNEIVRPADRLLVPLGDDAALLVGQKFGVERMIEHVARARRRCIGSAFPTEWHRSAPTQSS